MALITISSNFGSGGEKIAKRVSDQLGVEFFDDRILQQRVLAMGISKKEVESFDGKAPGFFDRLFTNKPAIYMDLIGAVIYDVAGKGEGVIVGHGAQAFLQNFNCAFHVMIHASDPTRSQWLTKEYNINEASAMGLVRKMDKRLKDFVQYAFDRDWNDPTGYDMVISLDKIGAEWATKLIIEVAKSDEIKECSFKALEEMESSSLKRRIDAAIIKNNLTSLFTLILVQITGKGQVQLSGWTPSENEHKKILGVVKGVSGVSEVKSEIILMPPAD